MLQMSKAVHTLHFLHKITDSGNFILRNLMKHKIVQNEAFHVENKSRQISE